MTLTILGLGPWHIDDLTRRAWRTLENAQTIYLRTQWHPCVPHLPNADRTQSFDSVYEFEDVYKTIVLAFKLKIITGQMVKQLCNVIRIFQPETVLKWHRELVRRKWTYQRQVRDGRPRTDSCNSLKKMIGEMARSKGNCSNLAIVSAMKPIASILKRHRIPPLHQRRPSLSWRHLMTH